jgi:hypothetical protein
MEGPQNIKTAGIVHTPVIIALERLRKEDWVQDQPGLQTKILSQKNN